MTANICPTCKVSERIYDDESGGYFTYCSGCFAIHAAAPYCYSPKCSGRVCGTRTAYVKGSGLTAETARYACPNGCGTATAVGWAIGAGRHAARADFAGIAEGRGWLVDARMDSTGIAGSYNAAHPVRRAYARAYVDSIVGLRGV